MKFIKGPDFPTGGQIFDAEAIKDVYATGRGKILVRGKAEIEETKKGRFQILVTEIPYQVNKADLVAKIAFLAKEKKIEGIADLRDESDRQGIRIVIELKKAAKPMPGVLLSQSMTNRATTAKLPIRKFVWRRSLRDRACLPTRSNRRSRLKTGMATQVMSMNATSA